MLACFGVSGVATLGTLALSGIMQLPCCVLCLYQRIFLFPLVPVTFVGLIMFDRRVAYFSLPLAGIGLLLAVVHLFVITETIPAAEAFKSCIQGIRDSKLQAMMWFGFETIPMLSTAAFSVINALLVAAHLKISK
ncbi:disulfide bond formation protein DsbB [Azoarcus sp. CIB]|nr:disulfide bond formation protein DsbB [Azoarcus sp. CIB]